MAETWYYLPKSPSQMEAIMAQWTRKVPTQKNIHRKVTSKNEK